MTVDLQNIAICQGAVMHKRLRPALHQFRYPAFFMRIPAEALAVNAKNTCRWFSVNRFNLLSLKLSDYGARDGSSPQTWVRNLLDTNGIDRADGQITLQTFPRLLGYAFNPISIWYCHDQSGALIAAICEVNNTFGECHHYLVAHADQRAITPDDWLTAKKMFHVSPFCEVRGHYRFRFEQTASRAFAQVDFHDGAADTDKLIITTIHGTPASLTSSGAIRTFLRYPLMTIAVIARIHWQALLLWRKHVPFFAKPLPPTFPITKSH